MVFTICLYFHSLPACIYTFIYLISEYLLMNSLELNEFRLYTYFQLQYYLEERRSNWKAFCSFELAFKYVCPCVHHLPTPTTTHINTFSFSPPISQKNFKLFIRGLLILINSYLYFISLQPHHCLFFFFFLLTNLVTAWKINFVCVNN